MWQLSPLVPLEQAPEASSIRGFCQVPLALPEEFPCPLSGSLLRVQSLELLTASGFQDCNHFCQFWKGLEDLVKHLSRLSLWRFCTIL